MDDHSEADICNDFFGLSFPWRGLFNLMSLVYHDKGIGDNFN